MPTKRRKTATPTVDAPAPIATETATATATAAVSEPDVFDRAIAARTGAVAEAAMPPAAEPADAAHAAISAAFQPDPFPNLSISLGEGNDAPRVRLYRNRRMNQVAVRFDEKPPEPVRQRMRDEGYKWREAEGVWTKQLGDQRASGQLAAERLVEDVGNAIRAEGGLPPVGRAVGE